MLNAFKDSKLLSGILFLLVLSSCGKQEQGQTPLCMNVRGNLDIVYLNMQGQNLLDESTANYYPADKMKLYFLENGNKTLVNHPMSDAPSGISIIKESLPVRISVMANVGFKGDVVSDDGNVVVGLSTALLQMDENVTDTIKTEWESGKCYLLINKAWYNSKLVYDVKAGLNGLEGREGFIVIK